MADEIPFPFVIPAQEGSLRPRITPFSMPSPRLICSVVSLPIAEALRSSA